MSQTGASASPPDLNPANDDRPIATGGAWDPPGFSWALFEWARNPYYIMIVIYIFAPYFAEHVIAAEYLETGQAATPEEANARGQAAIASVTKWAGFCAGLTAPFLGAALDRGGRRKPILAVVLGVLALMSYLLWWAKPAGEGFSASQAMTILVIAYVCYAYSEVIHNAMLGDSARASALPAVSGNGLAFGNLAGLLIFIALVVMFALPGVIAFPLLPEEPLFGIDRSAQEHFRIVGPICAIWMLLFMPPFFRYVPDRGRKGADWVQAAREGALSLWRTFKRAREYRDVITYLGARMLYADGMAALLALGATYVALFLGWSFLEMIVYAIYASAFAFLGGFVGAALDTRFGSKRALIIEVVGLLIVLAAMLSVSRDAIFFGLIQGGTVWNGPIFQTVSDLTYLSVVALLAIFATASISSSRSMLVAMAPAHMRGEFFGLYAIAGTITVWMGPLLVELFTTWFKSQRVGMSAISLLFLAGLIVLLRVKHNGYARDEA
ncbi:MAG: MFS transporter [Pseudomonadota bacterium]